MTKHQYVLLLTMIEALSVYSLQISTESNLANST